MRDMRDKAELKDFLLKTQRTFCVYDTFGITKEPHKAPSMCDCKYGADDIGGHSESGNGCPEMREIRGIFAGMTEKEYERIVKRMAKRAAKEWKKFQKTQKYKEITKCKYPKTSLDF